MPLLGAHSKTAVNRAWTLQIAITRALPTKNAIRGLCPIRVLIILHLILNSYHRMSPPTLSSCSINLFSLTPKQTSVEPRQPEPFLRGECQYLAKIIKVNLPRPFVKLPSCTLMCQPQLNPRFRISRRKRNRWMHAMNGNTQCTICHCDLYPKLFPKHNRHFNKPAFQLGNGMMVHHFHNCKNHLSVWFYRKGLKHYQVYYHNKAKNLHRRILAARAASGKPGDHDSPKQLLAPFFALHSFENRIQLDYSGHESRSASGDTPSHQNLRSADARLRRHLA